MVCEFKYSEKCLILPISLIVYEMCIQGKIYTYVANILIAVNPYSSIPDLYSAKTIR